MSIHRFALAAALASVIFSAAASAASDQYRIAAPAGWEAKSSSTPGIVGYWVAPQSSGFRQNLNLVSDRFSGSLAAYVDYNVTGLKKTATGAAFGPEGDFQTCGGHTAHYMSWQSSMLGHQLIFEQALSVWFGRGYVLTYTREAGQPELSDAQAALATLCVRQH